MLLSRNIKLHGLPPSTVTVSLHYLPKTWLPGPDGPKMPNCTSKLSVFIDLSCAESVCLNCMDFVSGNKQIK